MTQERELVAGILREHREELMRRWTGKVLLLARERGAEQILEDPSVLQDAREFLELMVRWLEGEGSEADMASFYHLILEGHEYHVRLADIAYVLLELKSVGKQVIFENLSDELSAFRVSRLLDDAVEGVLRKSADLYELTSRADQQTAEERLQEIFTAWELESALAHAETPEQVCRIACGTLRDMWAVRSCCWRLYHPPATGPRDVRDGTELPVPMVEEQRQYLTRRELEAGGTVSLIEAVRRRREPYTCEDVASCADIVNAPELLAAGVRSLVCHPLVARDRVVGVLLAAGGQEGLLRRADLRKLEGLASVVALALDRTGRLQLSHKRLSEAEVIARIGRSLLELPTRDALLQGVAAALREFRDYFDVSLLWLDEEAGECVLVAEAGRERRYRPEDYRQAVGEGFIGICAETGETIRATDLERDSRRLIAFEEEYQVRTELAVPVRRGEEVLGVIHLLSDREDDFPDSDVAGIEHVAPHIGVALQNARMMDQRTRDRYELERAHRQLANIIRSTAVGITSADTRGVYNHWSPSCEAMLGYSAAEVIDRKTAADFAAEPYDLAGALRECREAGRAVAERTWLRKDGTPRTIRETRVPLADEQGTHIGFTSYLVDVTEQKRAQEQLRRERDMLQLVVDAMGAGLALFDADLRLQWANSTLTNWFELSEEDLGKKCHDIYLCGRRSERECAAIKAALAGRPLTRLHEFTDRAGQWHCYQQVFTPTQMGETRLVVLSMDVTEQRRQNEQLRLISKLTEKVDTSLDLERVLHLVLTCVTAGHAIGCNRAAVFLLDEQGEYLEGKMAVGPTSGEDASRIWHELERTHPSIDQLLESASPSDSDRELTERVRFLRIPVRRTDNTLVSTLLDRSTAYVGDTRTDAHVGGPVAEALELEEFVCVPLAAQDEPLGVMLADNKYSGKTVDRYQVELLEMFCRQASLAIANARAYERIRSQLQEIRRTRDRLIAAERMASVGRMAGHLAHEIRNPLTTIGGFAASIARRHPDDSVTHRNASIIHDEVRRLERTLVNVLDYTRPLRPDKEPIQINELVMETVAQFDQQLQEADIKIRMSLAEELPPVMADRQMIKQVVLNLVKNAMEAMEDKEQATLSVITSAEEERAVIEVADTGGGMPPEVRENLFSPFFTTKIGGVGLGLSVSQRIVRQHGGDIDVQSELGVGSRFVVSLATEQPEQEGV